MVGDCQVSPVFAEDIGGVVLGADVMEIDNASSDGFPDTVEG
jgi:hypothetical protein